MRCPNQGFKQNLKLTNRWLLRNIYWNRQKVYSAFLSLWLSWQKKLKALIDVSGLFFSALLGEEVEAQFEERHLGDEHLKRLSCPFFLE